MITGLLRWWYLFNHNPGHWIPSCVSFAQWKPSALAYPEFNPNRTLRKILTETFEEVRMVDSRRWTTTPEVVKDWVNRHGTTAFVAVKLKIPSVAFGMRIFTNIALVWDFKGRIDVQLVEGAFLEKKYIKTEKLILFRKMNTYLRSTQIIFQHCKFKKCGNGVCEMESVADENRLYTYNF